MLRFYVFTFILFCSLYQAYAENLILHDLKDIEFKNENGQEKAYLNGELFAGAVTIADDKGQNITYIYKNGEKNGVATAKYANDDLLLEINYLNNMKNGDSIYFYPNKIPLLKESYKDDVLHGEKIVFYENGKPKEQSFYENGKLSGTVTYFDKQGNVRQIINYQDDIKNGIERIIENNVLRIENNYVNGKLDGLCKKFGEKFLEEETNYKNGVREGIQKIYQADGSWQEITYVNDIKSGEATNFYPNKSVAQQISYRYDAKNGIAKSFYQGGKIKAVERYKDDKLSGLARYFDESGRLQFVRYYVDGTKMADINLADDLAVSDLYKAYQNGQLPRFSAKKNLWYPILWLGLNEEKHEILDILVKDMQMYAASIGDENVYKQFSKANFAEYNRKLFFGMSPLSYALHLDADTALLQKFVSEINVLNERGTMPLHEAIELDDEDIVKYLLLNHADVQATDNQNETAIFVAIKGKANLNIISLLLKYGADVNAKDTKGYTPLMLAIRKQNEQLAKLLLQNGASVNELTPKGKNMLFYAYINNAPQEIIKTLLKSDVNVNLKDNNGNFVLNAAIKNNDVAFVKELISKKADVNLIDSSSNSALSYVLTNKDVALEIRTAVISAAKDFTGNVPTFDKSLSNVLLEQNDLSGLNIVWSAMKDIDKPDINGVNPLYTALQTPQNKELLDLALSFVKKADSKLLWTAVKSHNLDFLQQVMLKEPPLNEKNAAGETVLTYMAKNKFALEYFKAVESAKPDINLQNDKGQDALEIAVQNKDIALIENLLQEGADANRVTNGKTYLMNFSTADEKMTALFIKNNADLNALFADNQTMLMTAVSKLNLTLFDALLANGANVNARDAEGRTALLYIAAALENYSDMPDDELQAKLTHIIKGLQAKGADINAQDNSGETLLMLIARNHPAKFALMSAFLAEFGCHAELKNQYGKTAAELLAIKP